MLLSQSNRRALSLLSGVLMTSCGGLVDYGDCVDCEEPRLDDAPLFQPPLGSEPIAATGGELSVGGNAAVGGSSSIGGGTVGGTTSTGGSSVTPAIPNPSSAGGSSPVAPPTGGRPSIGTGGRPPVLPGTGGRPPIEPGSGGRPPINGSGGDGSGGEPPIEPCVPSPEVCDGADNDCNGQVDEVPWCDRCTDAVFSDTPYIFCDSPLSFFDAEALCDSWGLALTTPTNAAENEWISEVGNQRFSRKFWIGFSDVETEGVWINGDGVPADYTNWHSAEPNNVGGIEHCAQLNRFWPQSTWNDEPCDDSLPFSCEPKTEPPPCEYKEVSLNVAFDTRNPAVTSSISNTSGLIFDDGQPFTSLYVGDGDWRVTYDVERSVTVDGIDLSLNPGASGTYQTFYNAGGGALRGSVIYVRKSGELATSPNLEFLIEGLPERALFDLVIFGQAQGQVTSAVNPTEMLIVGHDAGNGVGQPVDLDAENDGNFVGVRSSADGTIEGRITYVNEFGAIAGIQLRSRSECED